jgi:alpha-N-arabinofuranosidase
MAGNKFLNTNPVLFILKKWQKNNSNYITSHLIKNNLLKLFSLFFFIINIAFAQQNTISQNKEAARPVINKNIYGHIAEHLGYYIYDGFYVGDTSPIPNTDGVSNDIIAALKKLKIPNLHWPSGSFADNCHWKDGIGPKDKGRKEFGDCGTP